jgi:hypothetical protein
MSIAALRHENEQLKALLAQTQAALSEHQGALVAHSRDGDQVFQAMVITDSSDRDQVRRRTRLTGLSVLEIVSWSRLTGWFEDRSGGPWEGPVRGAECPQERRSDARGRGLWAGGAIVREVLTAFSFRWPDAVDCRL